MADRFPLAVNYTSRKIEEFVSGDNLDLTGNGISINGNAGVSGQYLKSTGAGLVWDTPGNVYLTDVQTITNKTIESSFLSGSTNTFINIPNSALINDFITVNGTNIDLGGTVTTPNDNTTYSVSAQDGAAGKKIIRLTSGGNFGSGVDDDVTLVAGTNVTLGRNGDEITINSSFVDTNTITRLAGSGGTFQSGDITIAAGGSVSVSQVGNTITLTGIDTNTVTRLRGTAAGTFESGDISILASGATAVTQSSKDITISSVDTITRLRGTGGTFQSGDVTIAATGSSTVSQVGNTITIDSSYIDTVTRLRGTTSGIYQSGDITLVASGATTISQNGNTITISSVNTDTGASLTASKGIVLNSTNFELKNADNLTGSRILKWDTANTQVVSSIIEDDGSLITINGDLKVTGSTTTVESQTLIIADAQLELRKGLNLTGTDGGIQFNRATNNLGLVTSYSALQWFESGQYWRTYDGSVSQRLVTEGEAQTLTNKTLTSPILTAPTLGIATATSINGLAISQTVSGTLTIASNKTLTANNTLTLTGTDGSSVAFGGGGTVAYTANNLSVFANTTSSQLRGILTDETGTGVAVFGTSPRFTTSVTTQSASFSVFNSGATTINAFGAATELNFAATTGTTTIRNSLAVDGNTTLGNATGDTITINGTLDSVNNDIVVRGSTIAPISIGRGGNAIASNTRVGYNALNSNTSGSQNTAFGYEAGFTLNSGSNNTVFGYQALRNGSTAENNVAIGNGSAFNTLDGDRNVSVGVFSLSENQFGNSNVCIGYYAGYNCLGSGNVLIGPADNGNSTDSTYQPPSVSGDRQLVIGSGTGTWLRGDSNFDVTAPNNFNVGGSLIVSGNITVNGTTTTINSNTLTVDDKTIEIGSVTAVSFAATTTNNSSTITGISPTNNLIPGVVVSSLTAGITVPLNTFIVSITGTTAVLSENVTGSGPATFTTAGASDTSADGGGIVLKGTSDKSITWSDTTDAWTSTEHFDLATGKQYRLGNVLIASSTQIGPSTGSFSLGGGVTASSLTSVGTLTSLNVTGATSVQPSSTLSTSSTPYGISIQNTSTKTYPSTSSFISLPGLYQNLELGTSQTINTVTPGGFNFTYGIYNNLTKSAGSTSDIERLYFNGFYQSFTWSDSNTCKQYAGFSDFFSYQGIDANGRTSAALTAKNISLVPPNGGTQTISSVTAESGIVYNSQGTTTINVTTSTNLVPSLRITNSNTGTKTVNITTHTFFGTNTSWGTAGGVGTLNATITNLYGLRLTAPASTTGLTVTNKWGISQEWADANNYFAGNIQMGAGKGIDFSANDNAAGMTSELLDDYEEGTWTPTFGRSITDPTVSYAAGAAGRIGTYTKIGNMVYAFWDMTSTAYSGGSGDAWLRGLPFNVSSTQAGYSVVQWRDSGSVPAGAAGTTLKGYVQQGSPYIAVQYDDSGANGFGTNSTVANWQTGRTTGYVIYQTDS